MKIKINKDILIASIDKVAKPLSRNGIKEILSGMKIEVSEEGVKLTTSDGIFSNQTFIEKKDGLEIIETGNVLVAGKLFIEISKKQSKEITIELINDTLNVKSKNSNVDVNVLDFSSYPKIDFEVNEKNKTFTMSKEEFNAMLNEVGIACSDSDKRVLFQGINIKSEGSEAIKFSATDSYRFSTKVIESSYMSDDINVNIFHKNLKVMIPTKMTGDIDFIIDTNKLLVKNSNTISQSRLIDGIFPDLDKATPKDFKHHIIVDTKKFVNLIEKVSVVSSDNKSITMTIKNNELKIKSVNTEFGVAEATMKDIETNVEDFTISLDGDFLKQTLKSYGGVVQIELLDTLKPLVFSSKEKPNLTQLILPHRV